ncbi:hypothetical protein O181_055804 [Austropuccinia psidii MF-1]|uniref:Uncharacterized protein n=1 Tax=Austropuccinia psidii MF-1 TaxID=1389203 RepID=A0A9Q3E7A6_9BASI|nr:hypothetical protein [Austropuccinia psidii MF-1]
MSAQRRGTNASPEAGIISINVVRPESFPTGNNRDIPVSVQELVYGRKATGVGASSKSLDRQNELSSSSEEVHSSRKDRGSSEGLDTHLLQRKSPTEKSLVEKPKYFVRGPEVEVAPSNGKKASGRSSSLHKEESALTSAKQGQEIPKEQSEGQGKSKVQVKQALPTELYNSKERKDSHGKFAQYGKNSD